MEFAYESEKFILFFSISNGFSDLMRAGLRFHSIDWYPYDKGIEGNKNLWQTTGCEMKSEMNLLCRVVPRRIEKGRKLENCKKYFPIS